MSKPDPTVSDIRKYQRRATLASNCVVLIGLGAIAIATMWYLSNRSLRRAWHESEAQVKVELLETKTRAEAQLRAIQADAAASEHEYKSQISLVTDQLDSLQATVDTLRQDHEQKVNKLLAALKQALRDKRALERQAAALKVSRLLDPRPLPEPSRTASADTIRP